MMAIMGIISLASTGLLFLVFDSIMSVIRGRQDKYRRIELISSVDTDDNMNQEEY